MDIEELWSKALKQTEVIRARLQDLATFEATPLPYIFLAESSLNPGDTIVRKGQVLVERPSLILPSPQFQGFEFEQELHVSEDAMLNFLLVRGVRFPSLRYRHELSSLDLREGSLRSAIEAHTESLKQAENIHTGLVIGPEEAWQCSVLILVGSLVIRSAEGDVRRLLEQWKRRREG
jgi:hypothetical protein